MKTNIFFAYCALFLVLCGCSHNGLVVIDGKYFGATSSGIHYANGFLLIDESRENSHLRAELSDADSVASGASGNLRGVTAVEKAVGRQATGYLVDMAEVSPDAVKDYLKDDTGPAPFVGGDIPEISVDPAKPAQSAPSSAPAEKPAESSKDKIEDALKELGGKIEDCIGDECAPDEATSSVPTQDIWKGSPEEQKSRAFYTGQYLLVMYARSTCTNCKKVFENLQTDSFTKFLIDHNIVPMKYYSDGTENTYNFAADYVTEGSDTLNLPSFILCRPLTPTGNSYAPGVDVESLGCLPASLVDTEAKLEREILEAIGK